MPCRLRIETTEKSREDDCSYRYSYTVPKTIKTCSGECVELSTPSGWPELPTIVAPGIRIWEERRGRMFAKDTVFHVECEAEALPIRIAFTEGSGCGGKSHGDYSDSSQTEYWQTYTVDDLRKQQSEEHTDTT